MDESFANRWKQIADQNGGLYESFILAEIDPKTLEYLSHFFTQAFTQTGNSATGPEPDVPWLSWDAFVPRGGTVRDGYAVGRFPECKFLCLAKGTSPDGLWDAMLIWACHVSDDSWERLSLLSTYNLQSQVYRTSLMGSVNVSIRYSTADQWGRHDETSLQPRTGENDRGRILLEANDVYSVAVDDLSIKEFEWYLRSYFRGKRSPLSFVCRMTASVGVTLRRDLSSIGRGLQDNYHVLSMIVEQGRLSLRDVQNLALTSKHVKVSVKEETEHRLRKVLAPYFPDALDELVAALQKHKGLIGGSTMLSILKPGDWEPEDLDIIILEGVAREFEEFLESLGYDKADELDKDIAYAYEIQHGRSTPFRWSSFRRQNTKIDLCYVSQWHTPLSHILSYHSTPVMNYFDGKALYCLFPEHTFTGRLLRNNYYPGTTPRLIRALEKLKRRGFVETGNVYDWIGGDFMTGDRLQLRYLPTMWRQVVDLEASSPADMRNTA